MPSAMPSQTPRKPCGKSRRKLTTLSFEQLDKGRTSIFTEDISSSSRIRKPSYVLRQGDVVGANMPDTIKLAKHRSKIYVGLSDSSSIASSRRDSSRVTCRSDVPSSAATTIGKASIIDWTDAGSDVGGNVPLAGELSFLLPPVPGARTVTSNHTPPGLDTTDIFNYRAVQHKRRGAEKSPRQPPPSRGAMKYIAGFRPPQNTPFITPGRSDDFIASFRKKITPRATLESCNVVVCGGGIGPAQGTSRESRQKSLYSRESTNSLLRQNNSKRRHQSKDSNNTRNNNTNNSAGIGVASFDLPVIDLKCVESPITDLGDLEEKGIRLVKLRNSKKKQHTSQSSDTDKNGSLNGDAISEDVKSAINERLESNEQDKDKENEKELEPSFVRLALNGDGPEMTYREEDTDRPTHRKERSVTSSTTRSEPSRKQVMEEIGFNREPYSTPLLPNIDTNRTDTFRSPIYLGARDANEFQLDVRVTDNTNTANDSINIPIPNTTTITSPGINVVVENLDPTPINPPSSSGSSTPNTIFTPREDGYAGDSEPQLPTTGRKIRHRTSSLLSVPASIISECRPPTPPARENLQQQQQLQNDAVLEGSEEGGGGSGGSGGNGEHGQAEMVQSMVVGDGGGRDDEGIVEGTGNGSSKTISTQTVLVPSGEDPEPLQN